MSSNALPSLARCASAPPGGHRQSYHASLQRPGLQDALACELEAKRQFVAMHRSLLRTAVSASTTRLHAQNRARALAKRRELAEESGKVYAESLKSIPPASEAMVNELALQLNLKMAHLFPGSRSQSSYFKLFHVMDRDRSGLISIFEFEQMVRTRLRIPPDAMSKHDIRALWRVVDEDASVIASG